MKEKKYVLISKTPCRIKIENKIVEMEYATNQKKFEECMINILKQKQGG